MAKFFAFGGYRQMKYDPAFHTEDDVVSAAKQMFEQVAHDLGVDDIKDPAFQDYFGDNSVDAGIPVDVRKRAEVRLFGKVRR